MSPPNLATVVHRRNMDALTPRITPTVVTRRNLISGAALTLLGLRPTNLPATSQQPAPPPSSPNATSTSLHQEIALKTTPARIYSVLLESKQFAAFSHEPADIHAEPGGAFSMFGARILGRNVELVPNRRIVQAWRSAGWDPGTYSIVRFDLKEQGTQTRVVLDHTGFPVGAYDSLFAGWKSHYWDPLQLFFP
jgi:activator of HSP90 ATPase